MQYKSVKGFTGLGQFGILLVFLGLGFILAGGVQLVIALKMVPSGTAFKDLENAMLDAMGKPENVGYARWMQVMGSLCLLFVPAVLYSWITNGRNKYWLGFNPYINISQIIIGFFIIFTANIVAAPLEELSKAILIHMPSIDKMAKQLEDTYNDQVMILSNLKSWPEFIMAIFIMAFLPALFEEVFFRGAMQNLFVRWWKMPLLAIFVTSVFFSLIHSSIYLFASRLVLGFALGLMFHICKNIWVNVIAHFLNNTLAVIQLFYLSNHKPVIAPGKLDTAKMDPSKMDPKIEWWVALIALVALYFLIRQLRKVSINNRIKIEEKEQLIIAKDNTHNPFAKIENN